jgi:hypothetical protein
VRVILAGLQRKDEGNDPDLDSPERVCLAQRLVGQPRGFTEVP